MKRAGAVALALSVLLLAGCAGTTDEPKGGQPSVAATTPEASIGPADIDSVEDAAAWSESLDESTTAVQIAEGIEQITPLVQDSGVPTLDANRINRELLSLQLDVLDQPETASSRLPDLRKLIDEIGAD